MEKRVKFTFDELVLKVIVTLKGLPCKEYSGPNKRCLDQKLFKAVSKISVTVHTQFE